MEWRKMTMEEQAKEELEALQVLHPDRFDYLKLELKSFIHLLQSHSHHFPHETPISLDPASQESSSCKKRRRGDELQRDSSIREIMRDREITAKMNRVDVVLQRAAGCLRKIKRFKTALFSTA